MDNSTDPVNDISNTPPTTPRAAWDIAHAGAEAVESIAEPIVTGVREGNEQAHAIKQTMGRAVKAQVDRVNRGAKKAYRSIKKSGQEFEEVAQNTIRRTPITTVLVAAGIGAFVGYFLGRESVRHPARHWGR
jgi:ElaB/YqjD/DUF883 family membrane-anchored ribosome-binding protein